MNLKGPQSMTIKNIHDKLNHNKQEKMRHIYLTRFNHHCLIEQLLQCIINISIKDHFCNERSKWVPQGNHKHAVVITEILILCKWL